MHERSTSSATSRRAWLVAGAGACAIAAACAAGCGLWGGPRTIVVTQAQLQQAVARRFPVERRYLELIDVTVAVPRVTLRPDADRVWTELEVLVSERLTRSQHRGTIALNHGLRYDASDQSVRLTDVRVERLEVDGASAALRQQLDRIGVLLAEQTLNERAVYTLTPRDAEAMRSRGLRPGGIRVTPDGLAIDLLGTSD